MSYSKAIYEINQKDSKSSFGSLEILEQIVFSLESSPLGEFFSSPNFSTLQKREILTKIFPILLEKKQQKLFSLLKLLIEKHKFRLVPIITKELKKLISQENEEETATVKSCFELSKASQEKLKKFLEQETGSKKIALKSEIKGELLGGLVLESENFVFDQSLKSRLNRLKAKLINEC